MIILTAAEICSRCKKEKLIFPNKRNKWCKDCYNEYCRNYRKNNLLAQHKRDRKSRIKCLYGISLEIYEKMYKEQNGLCKICKRQQETLCVDHNHRTGKVRGLLCRYCNVTLGNLERKDLDLFNSYIKDNA